MIFRDATLDDLSFIVHVYNSTIEGRMVTADTTPINVADKLQWYHEHHPATRPLWVVEVEDHMIGWVSFQDFYGRPAYSGTAEISIYLAPGSRGKGFGHDILQHCLNVAPTLQIHTLLGFIFAHNIPSIELFTKAGFQEWAHLPEIAVMDEHPYSLKIFGKKVST